MKLPGHVGAALTAYAPIAYGALELGAARLALAGAVATVVLASLPDLDLHVPALSHRGATHTVWFAAGVGVVSAVAFASLGDGWLPVAPTGGGVVSLAGGPAAFGFVVGTTATLTHLAVDALTPMGVAPFAPLGRRYSFGVTTSASPVANRRLLLLGLVAVVGAVVIGAALDPSAW